MGRRDPTKQLAPGHLASKQAKRRESNRQGALSPSHFLPEHLSHPPASGTALVQHAPEGVNEEVNEQAGCQAGEKASQHIRRVEWRRAVRVNGK